MGSAQFCGQCGARIAATEKFCTACGSPRKLVGGSAATAPAVPADREELQIAKNNISPAAPTPADPPGISAESSTNPKGLLTSGVVYVLVYLILAVPTYVLPYFGSNSSVLNVMGAAMGLGALPQFWFHLVALYLLVVVAWIRGGLIGAQWLAIFPVLAAIFDMVPGFSVIPLLPTIFHVLTLVKGVSGKLVAVDDAADGKRRIVFSAVGFAAIAILALVKTQAFFHNAKQGPSWEKPNAQQQSLSSSPSPSATLPKNTKDAARFGLQYIDALYQSDATALRDYLCSKDMAGELVASIENLEATRKFNVDHSYRHTPPTQEVLLPPNIQNPSKVDGGDLFFFNWSDIEPNGQVGTPHSESIAVLNVKPPYRVGNHQYCIGYSNELL